MQNNQDKNTLETVQSPTNPAPALAGAADLQSQITQMLATSQTTANSDAVPLGVSNAIATVHPPAADPESHSTKYAVDLSQQVQHDENIGPEGVQANPTPPSASLSANGIAEVISESTISSRSTTSKKVLLAVTLSFAAVFIVGGGSASAWYFVLRTPDNQYEKAAAIVDNMISDVQGIESARSQLDGQSSTSGVTTTSVKLSTQTDALSGALSQLSNAKEKAADYLTNEKNLSELSVVTKDGDINALYSVNKSIIKDYGVSADEAYRSAYVLMTVLKLCFMGDSSIVPNSSTMAADQYDLRVKNCKDYLTQNKTVALKDFNDLVYAPYRNMILSMISNLRIVLSSPQGSTQWKQAQQNIINISADARNIDTSRLQDKLVKQSPKDRLEKLKAKIDERKKVFLR